MEPGERTTVDFGDSATATVTYASKISVKAIGSSVEAKYSRLLTSYAAKLVREQLEKVEKVQFLDRRVKDTKTSSVNCSCYFHQTMKLSCCHFFTLRKRLQCLCLMKICHTEDGIWLTTKLSIVSSVTAKLLVHFLFLQLTYHTLNQRASIRNSEPERLQSLWEVGKTNHGRTQTAR